MNIYDKIKYFNPFRRKIKYLDSEGKPKTTVKAGGKQEGSLFSQKERTEAQLKKYWQYYTQEGTVWAAINSIAYNTVMVGYDIESNDKEAKKIIERWCRKVDLPIHLLNNTIYGLVFGDSFIEIIKNKKQAPSSLKDVDPQTMEVNFDKYGIVQNYTQSLGKKAGESVPKLDKESICHIRFFPKPNDPYGLSLISPNVDILDKKVRADNAIASAIIRHGTSKLVFSVGSEKDGQLPPDSVLEAIESEVEDIDEKNEFVVPWNVDVYPIDEKGIQGVEDYYNYFQSQLVLGLLVPGEVLGLGQGSTEATARVRALLYERMIQSFQTQLAAIVEKQLFKKVLQANGYNMEDEENDVYVKINFRSVTDADESEKAKWMGNLIRGFRSSKTKPFTINEIRRMFNKPELDDPEADTIIYEGYEKNDTADQEPSEENVTNEDDDMTSEKEEEDEEES